MTEAPRIRIKRLATMMSNEFDIHVISYYQGRDGAFPFKIHRTPPLPLKIKRSGASLAKLLYDILLVFKTISVVRKEKIRVIEGHLHEGAFIGLLASIFSGSSVIYNAHGTFVKELTATGAIKEGSPMAKPLSSFENWVERKVDFIVAQSLLRRDELISKGLPSERVAAVEDVPELEDFYLRDEQLDRDLEKRLRPAGEKLLIYSGGMEEYQGVDFLMVAFQKLCSKRKNVRLVLFGRPVEGYKRIADEMGISERVVFVDNEPFERLPQYLNICDIAFALRLYGENVPGKLPVYMASGIAVIGTDTKGINTVLEDGKNGLLVKPGDLDTLVTRINYLLDCPDVALSLGKKGREEAQRRYSPDKARDDLARIYNELLNRSR